MAKVIKAFEGYYDGEHELVRFKPGDEVRPGSNLERVALAEGWCEKAKPAPKNKARSVPQNKASGSASLPGRRSRKKTSKKPKTKT